MRRDTKRRHADRRLLITRSSLGLAAAGLYLIGMAAPAATDNMVVKPAPGASACLENPDFVARTDNVDLYVHYSYGLESPTAPMRTASNRALAEDYGPTDLVIHDNSTNTADIQAVTNIFETTYCGLNWLNLRGFVDCKVLWPTAGVCDKSEVHFDAADTTLLNANAQQALACHEFGHAVGLLHRLASTTCMRNDGVLTSVHLDNSHEWPHINAAY